MKEKLKVSSCRRIQILMNRRSFDVPKFKLGWHDKKRGGQRSDFLKRFFSPNFLFYHQNWRELQHEKHKHITFNYFCSPPKWSSNKQKPSFLFVVVFLKFTERKEKSCLALKSLSFCEVAASDRPLGWVKQHF